MYEIKHKIMAVKTTRACVLKMSIAMKTPPPFIKYCANNWTPCMRIMGNYQTELAVILNYVSKGKMIMKHKNDNVLKALVKITDGRIKFGLCVDAVAVYDCNMRHVGKILYWARYD